MAATDGELWIKDDSIEKSKSELVGGIVDIKNKLDNFIEIIRQAPKGEMPRRKAFDDINQSIVLLGALLRIARRNPKGE